MPGVLEPTLGVERLPSNQLQHRDGAVSRCQLDERLAGHNCKAAPLIVPGIQVVFVPRAQGHALRGGEIEGEEAGGSSPPPPLLLALTFETPVELANSRVCLFAMLLASGVLEIRSST